ncbi:MAG: TIGR02757 family protein [Bacteroidales bacterium]|nr:TIGR02757 family protein [Bacteroidales bacterium]
MDKQFLREFLEEKYMKYNHTDFISADPLQVPHMFTDPCDIEIAAFLTASIAWGQRAVIIKNAHLLMNLMENRPMEFILNADESDFNHLSEFKHRTFNGSDTIYFARSLRNIYSNYGGLKEIFEHHYLSTGSVKETIIRFRKVFTGLSIPGRTQKHIADIEKNAAGKRLNLFIRWMVRKDKRGVDFGIWDQIPASALFIPLDIHTGAVARKLGLLIRKQNDWQAVEELTCRLREFDPEDPVKYDFALFGLGIFEDF